MEKDNEREEVKRISSTLNHIIDIIYSIKQVFNELYNQCNCRKQEKLKGCELVNDELNNEK